MPFRFDGIETGLWNHDAAEAGYFPAVPVGMAHRAAGSANETLVRNRATHQLVATRVWRAGHAQMTEIHFRAIKRRRIILK